MPALDGEILNPRLRFLGSRARSFGVVREYSRERGFMRVLRLRRK
jgi:hypothetical protein